VNSIPKRDVLSIKFLIFLVLAIIGTIFVIAQGQLGFPEPGEVEEEAVCTDSDGGENIFVKGTTVSAKGKSHTDECSKNGKKVNEGVCKDLKNYEVKKIECSVGCEDGACVKCSSFSIEECTENDRCEVVESIKQPDRCAEKPQICTDSDGGENIFVKGTTVSAKGKSHTDECTSNGKKVNEGVCKDLKNYEVKKIECSVGCEDGVCIKEKFSFNIKLQGQDDARLEFKDNNNNLAYVPLFFSDNGILKLGDDNDDLRVKEGLIISKDDYFIVTGPNSASYALRYRGADKITDDNPVIKFDDTGSGNRIERTLSVGDGIGQLKLGGNTFRIYNASSIFLNDFDILVDLNGDGLLGQNTVEIVNYNKESILIG